MSSDQSPRPPRLSCRATVRAAACTAADAMVHAVRCAVAMALLAPSSGIAALGEAQNSIEKDRVPLHADHIAWSTQLYRVHELTTPSGTRVREFVAPSGVVFAISWQGPFLPDLRSLLGANYESLQALHRGPDVTHSKLLLDRADLVIHSEGHLRAFAGQAYLPPLVPAGVAVTELR